MKRKITILSIVMVLILLITIGIVIYMWNQGTNLTAKRELNEGFTIIYKIRYNPISNYTIKKILKFDSEEAAKNFAKTYDEINKYLDEKEKIKFIQKKKQVIITYNSLSELFEDIDYTEDNFLKETAKEFFKSKGYKVSW